jgi:hypothetical protein
MQPAIDATAFQIDLDRNVILSFALALSPGFNFKSLFPDDVAFWHPLANILILWDFAGNQQTSFILPGPST